MPAPDLQPFAWQSLLTQSLPASLLKICILISVAYLLSRGPLFGRLLLYRTSVVDKLKVFAFFSSLVLIEWWINPVRFHSSTTVDLWAKQDMSVGIAASVTAGILVGPEMGVAVGFLAWLATAAEAYMSSYGSPPTYLFFLNPGLAACIGGLLGGWVMKFRPTPQQQSVAGFVVGALTQTIWLSLKLLNEPSLTAGSVMGTLVTLLIPWPIAIVSGGLGVLLFLWIIGDLKAQQERIGSVQIQRALRIANQTLPFLRQGLNLESAQPIADIVYEVAEVGAVALTDGNCVLAHRGAGADHHKAGDDLPPSFPIGAETHLSQEIVLDAQHVRCDHPDCPLTSGVLSPLVHEGEVIGGVVIYGVDGRPTNPEMVRLGVGLAQFFSNYQVELAELERQTQAASQAELKALQSQVHPHFLFNVLNTLAALCELDPRQAGKLTVKLGSFLRRSLRESPAPLIPLREEMENVKSYLEIEQARFRDSLTVIEEVPENALDALAPSFGLQILVENAVLHGTSKKAGATQLRLSAEIKAGRLWCVVQDEGPGFTRERQMEVFKGEGRASGLMVLRERGQRLLGKQFLLRIMGKKGEGTTVIMAIPQSKHEKIEEESALPNPSSRFNVQSSTLEKTSLDLNPELTA
jgi:two-component system sensor histidine kinase LytS